MLRQQTVQHAPIARVFAVALTRVAADSPFEKILHRRAFAGALAASLGQKTRESAPTDSLFTASLDVFRWRAADIFASVFVLRDDRAAFFRA
jgi:hypothetical protein